MLPSSHPVPIKSSRLAVLKNPEMLADAFSEFISASAQLEASYRDLQQEVAHLGVELAERNAALTRSLEENNRMRAALQQMIESMPCGVLVLDAVESIVTMNPEARRLLGPESAAAGNLAELSRLTRIDFGSLLAGANDLADHEICLATAAGKRWLAIRRRELTAQAQSMATSLRSICILRDITANKQAEQEREAARRATTLAEISTILAHEIRNPLASLELFAGLIAEDGGNNAEWIANLRAGIRTLSGTVNNVLSMNGGEALRLAPVDLPACVEAGVEFVRPIAEQAGVTLSCSRDGSRDRGPVSVLGNEAGIRQVILNLLCNAIRHTAAGGRVDVATRAAVDDGTKLALVDVHDTGCGIPEAVMPHLFEPGFSGTGETPGLGLAVCRRLMEQHSGLIRVSSREHKGSHFQLEFPAL